MTVHGDMGDAGHGAAMTIPFSAADWEELNNDDIVAAKVVVGLMISIFTIGLVLYSIVFAVVSH